MSGSLVDEVDYVLSKRCSAVALGNAVCDERNPVVSLSGDL